MSAMEKWNIIVGLYNKNINAEEKNVQSIWEKIFAEIFGYSSLAGEIEQQRAIRFGSSIKGYADIITKNNGIDLFVVELKRHNLSLDKDMEEQLFSYLERLRIGTGLLICNKIYIFSYDYNKKDYEQDKIEIKFIQDNPDGIKFIEMFSKVTFNEQSIKAFIHQKTKFNKNVGLIKQELTSELATDLLKNYFTDKYGLAEFEQAINDFSITVALTGTKVERRIPASDSQSKPVQLEESKRLSRSKIKNFCISSGINLSKNFNYANRVENRDTYNVDPEIERFSSDWWLALSDPLNNEIHVFKVPAQAILTHEIKVRPDNPNVYLFRIKCDDDSFEDVNSGLKFRQWHEKTIKY